MVFDYIDVVGVGGIGSALIEPLVRLLIYSNDTPKTLVLWDGDVIEDTNLNRQHFANHDIGKFKVFAIRDRLSDIISNSSLNLKTRKFYLNESIYTKELLERQGRTLVITSVDNVKTRSDVMKAIRAVGVDVVMISPGNGLDDGQVISWGLIGGEEYGTCRLDFDIDYQKPPDAIPNSCMSNYSSTPQLITANNMAASITLMLIHRLLERAEIYEEVQFRSHPFPLVIPTSETTIQISPLV